MSKKDLWKKEKCTAFQKALLSWYDVEKRILPWRVNTNPYHVWVSEIMLQQTRVDTVIPYYERFMEWFPTINALADAPEEKLLKAWEGLGYYSRVRNLQAAAQQIMIDYDGEMPSEWQEISRLKGIGPYTAGAILSIAFKQPTPAVDGNVMRVFSRLFCIKEDIAKASTRKIFEEKVKMVISPQFPGDFNQALMDLGSSICTPTSPTCSECPIQSFCCAYDHQMMEAYPVKTKKVKPKPVYYLASIIQDTQGRFLLEQRSNQGVLKGMWTFPLLEVSKSDFQQLQNQHHKYEQLELIVEEPQQETYIKPKDDRYASFVKWEETNIGEYIHVFSHLKWHVILRVGTLETNLLVDGETQKWLSWEEIENLPLVKPQQKMMEIYQAFQESIRHPFA